MKPDVPQKLTKSTARLQVSQALFSLTELEQALGRKKFKRRMEKVEKILLEGLPKEKKPKKDKTEASSQENPIRVTADKEFSLPEL